MNKPCCIIVMLVLVLSQSASADPYPPIPSIEELSAYIQDNQISPAEYVISKFKDHDVVFLGEFHRIRHDAVLVQNLIPPCYKNGIRVLALEFADQKDQRLIDSLLTLPEYDEALAQLVAFNNAPDWAYREYLDIYKAAWELNRSIPEGAPRFRIVGVNCSGDWSVMQTREDVQNDSLRRLVWQNCPGGELEWGFAILRQVWKGEKVLVYSGMHHAFTRYMLPNRDGNGDFSNFPTDLRMARQVWYRIGPRAFTVALHHAWGHAVSSQGHVRPVNGVIDSVMQLLGDQFRPVGFDVQGSPFGGLPDSASRYQVGYDDFRLVDYCDGYIFQRPFSQYETVHFVEDFINTKNFNLFRRQVFNPWHRNATLEQSKDAYKRQLERERQMYLGLQ